MTTRPPYPPTRAEDVRDVIHGREVEDPYRWLEDDDAQAVRAWEEAQNAFARTTLDALPQRPALESRLEPLLRFPYRTYPMPVLEGTRRFWRRRRLGDEEAACLTQATEDGPEEILIDPNAWGEEDSLGWVVPSRDGRRVAYGRHTGGSEDFVLRVRDVATGEDLPDRVRGRKHWLAGWLPGGDGFLYVCRPDEGEVPPGEEHYWSKVYLHRIGDDAANDRLVFGHDQTKEYWHRVDVSEDGRWLLASRAEMVRNELYLRRLEANDAWTPIATGFDATYQGLVVDGTLVVFTDAEAPRGRVFAVDAERPGRASWREIVPEGPDALQAVQAIDGHLFLTYLREAHTRIAVHTLDGRHVRDVTLPGLGTAEVSGHWQRSEVVVLYQSFDHPPTWYRYDLQADALSEAVALPAPFDPKAFTTEQVWFSSKDGTRVPMFLVHKKGLARDGTAPAMLTGYGGFRLSRTPSFTPPLVPWLEAGGVVALANLRGGGEFGAAWYEAAIRTRKQTSYDDFLAAAATLRDEGWCAPDRLVIAGGSNGGLLVGAALTQRPDLFRAVYCAVPLLDMVRYHRFSFANVWQSDYGSAEDPEEFAAILAYSPYHRVVDGRTYPPVFLTAGANDSRVHPLHARKMAARLQAANAGPGPILLHVKREKGHTGSARVTETVQDLADQWAFLMAAVDLEVTVA